MTQKVVKGMEIFATEHCEEAIEEAKQYIKRFGLDRDMVSIIKSDDTLLIRAKIDFNLEEAIKT